MTAARVRKAAVGIVFVSASVVAACPQAIAHLEGVYASQRPAYFMLPAHDFLAGMRERAVEFQNCTGGQIIMRAVTYSAWSTELRSDLGTTGETGAGLFDAYVIKSAWFTHYAELGKLEPLKEYIQTMPTSALQWLDVLPLIRDRLVSYTHEVYVMPNDADFVLLFERADLLKRDGRATPRTWEELIELATLYNGTDLNDDGTPDYGLCLPLDVGAFAMHMMSVHASVLQTRGVQQGFFFDAVTGQPLFDNVGSHYAFEIVRQLMALTPFSRLGPNYHFASGAMSDFTQGRCAFFIGAPGYTKSITLNGGVHRKDADGNVVWNVTERPRRVALVGSTRVYDFESGRLRTCTAELCPLASGDPLVNRPPFFGSGGFATAIGQRSPKPLKQMLFDFLAYLNAPSQSLPDVAALGFMDPYRLSHLDDSALSVYVDAGWPADEARDLFELENHLLANSNDAAAMDLRIPFRDDYIFEPSLPMVRTSNYANPQGWEYLVYQWLGWEQSPEGHWVPSGKPAEPVESLANRLQSSWITTMEDHGGVLTTLEVYRKSLGLPALSVGDMCEHHREEYESRGMPCPAAATGTSPFVWQAVAISVSLAVGVMLLVLCCCGMRAAKRSYIAGQEAKARVQCAKAKRVHEAVESVVKLDYPFAVLPFADFNAKGTLTRHEALRNEGLLVFLDTWKEAIQFAEDNVVVFVSHQWIGWETPDPCNVHFPAILAAIEKLSEENGLFTENLHVWVDYSSIPQTDNACKLAAIKSLVTYSGLSRYFLVCAPRARHGDTESLCNADTYAHRGWCRLEQWARMAVGGLQHMYIYNETGLALLSTRPGWQSESVDIFHGIFTHENDKAVLVDVVLGLWAFALKNTEEPAQGSLFHLVSTMKSTVFPREWFDDLVELVEDSVAKGHIMNLSLPHDIVRVVHSTDSIAGKALSV